MFEVSNQQFPYYPYLNHMYAELKYETNYSVVVKWAKHIQTHTHTHTLYIQMFCTDASDSESLHTSGLDD